ncbi:ASCH domain-containing protein [Agromyces sp. PvR057]|uniref:ASCH domain-containing protein n=1 Tax=Agromyces sp. PvR057 TaxID=3156403 RepID=UPI000E24B11A
METPPTDTSAAGLADNAPVDRSAAAGLWEAYRAARPELATDAEPPSVEQFGDHPELTDELLGLVIEGPKRATASLVAEFAAEGEPLPRVGSHWIACDSTGRPRAILRSTELRLAVIDEVDESFAYDEGEGDRTLAWWRDGHERYWRRATARLGFEWSPDLEIVLERFDVVWPAEIAD